MARRNDSSQASQYNCGVLLHNWYEDRFAPKAGALADVYPMPQTTYQDEFLSKTTAIRPMLRTGDLGKEILFGQGKLDEPSIPPVNFSKYEQKKKEWSELRNPEHAGRLLSTKHVVDTEVAQGSAALLVEPKMNKTTNFTRATLYDHQNMGLRQ